jgi:RHS repeat-associated protein
LQSNYAEGSSLNTNAGFYSETITGYDKNGNILGLQRMFNNILVDSLDYDYYNLDKSNQLKKITDKGTASSSVEDYPETSQDYEYDANGNLTYDGAKNFDISYYATLNLPKQLDFGGNNRIFYHYTADGAKLAKHSIPATGTGSLTHYVGNIVYEGASLSYIITDEGRFLAIGTGIDREFIYEYNLKDHLGNTRVTFLGTDLGGAVDIVQTTSYYPFGLVMSQMNGDTLTGYDKNKYLYNGKELQDDAFAGSSLNWYDYGARFYDPQIGRWHVVDLLAEKYESWSVYQYVRNNPILRIDPNGMDDYAINKKTGNVKLVKKTDDETDRIVQTKQFGKHKGEIKTNRKGEARTAFDGVEKGILSVGINFQENDNIIEVGGEGQPTEKGVKSFAISLSEYVGKEISGLGYSSSSSGEITDLVLGKYKDNSFTESNITSPRGLYDKFGDKYTPNNILQFFHTHPNGNLGATGSSNPELSEDYQSLQRQKPNVLNARFLILLRISGQMEEYDYTHLYKSKK